MRDRSAHGTVAGYRHGCRSRGGCALHGSTEFLTCAEAAIAVRSDRRLGALADDQPVPRPRPEASRSIAPESPVPRGHGTVWGYRRGCRASRQCPHWSAGRMTCSEARRRYFADYHDRRLRGRGTPIVHGSSAGYLSGCRDELGCPGDADGTTCTRARAAYRAAWARSRGAQSPSTTVCHRDAVERVAALHAHGMSLRRIAELAGVGRTTLSRMLEAHAQHGAPRGSALTRDRILALRSVATCDGSGRRTGRASLDELALQPQPAAPSALRHRQA